MSVRSRHSVSPMAFDDACQDLEALLQGDARRQSAEHAAGAKDAYDTKRRLRAAMQGHRFQTSLGHVAIGRLVENLDRQAQADGFHLLETWDPAKHRFIETMTPVLMLDFTTPSARGGSSMLQRAHVLIDFYFLHVLELLVMRAWGTPDPNAAFDRIDCLVRVLQGPSGSGHQFVEDAATLLSLAISQYQPDESAYGRLLDRVRTLDEEHQLPLALVNAANFGSHLRWGFRLMYGRDVERMRADNVVDYPWLMWSITVLAREYTRVCTTGALDEGRQRLVEGLANGLSPDPLAFFGTRPSLFDSRKTEYDACTALLLACRSSLALDLSTQRPTRSTYTPLALFYNFLHNVTTAQLVTALDVPGVPALPVNALLAGERTSKPLRESPKVLVHTLMNYASQPERRGAGGAQLIFYDFDAALESFEAVERALAAPD